MMKWFKPRAEVLPPPQSTEALIVELDTQLDKARELVRVLRERAKVAESVERARPE